MVKWPRSMRDYPMEWNSIWLCRAVATRPRLDSIHFLGKWRNVRWPGSRPVRHGVHYRIRWNDLSRQRTARIEKLRIHIEERTVE